jgi:hypothetical protein
MSKCQKSVLVLTLCSAAAFCEGNLWADDSVFVATAEGPSPNEGGVAISDNFYVLHRFDIETPTRVATIGGQFSNPFLGETRTIFAALVQLSGPDDVPDSLDLTTPDVLGHGLISVPTGDVDRATPLSIRIEPGWYAVGFGTGRFGAPSSTANSIGMESRSVDLAPNQFPFTAIQSFNNGPGFFQIHDTAAPRVFLTGTVVPEPSAPSILTAAAVALAACRFLGRRTNS